MFEQTFVEGKTKTTWTMLGGAANVARNAAAIGVRVDLLAVDGLHREPLRVQEEREEERSEREPTHGEQAVDVEGHAGDDEVDGHEEAEPDPGQHHLRHAVGRPAGGERRPVDGDHPKPGAASTGRGSDGARRPIEGVEDLAWRHRDAGEAQTADPLSSAVLWVF